MTADRIADVEARLARLEDERAIRHLISAYCYHADSGHDEELANLFTPEGILGSKVAGEAHAAVGADQISAQISDPNGHHRPDLYRHGLHLLGENLVVDVAGDTATASSYSLLVLKRESELVIYSASSNRWSLQRLGGIWRIAERSRRPVADEDFDEVLLSSVATEPTDRAGGRRQE
ncbi:MAG TPA: nuclear transport factor 2 family protein [Acidimicrobiales bacterium]|jgi:hypothetical protein|nr:nuclear transport factor 2 family protein [Acidimicrobiales bacterium]